MTPSRTPKPQVDTSRPNPARIYDFLLGGKDNYPVDQEVGLRMPPEAREGVAQNRAFMRRSAAWAARQGIDQFLDIGTGIPTEPNLHQVVQAVHPGARVVYADNDPIVLRHAEALLVSTPEGRTDYLQADVRDSASILESARATLDFSRPVALSLIALLHFVPDDAEAHGAVRTLVGALAPGSVLAISHFTADFLTREQNKTDEYRSSGIGLRPRTRDEVARFFDGLELVDPGLVTTRRWFQDGEPEPEGTVDGFHVGVARVTS